MSDLNHTQPFFTSVRHVVKAVSFKPCTKAEWVEFKRDAGDALYFLYAAAFRVVMFLLYPISILVLTAVARADSRHREKRTADARARFIQRWPGRADKVDEELRRQEEEE